MKQALIQDDQRAARRAGSRSLLNPLLLLRLSLAAAVQVKLWDGRTGRFVSTLVGHVGAVYMVAWAPDSRLLVSASKDSTLKLWEVRV